MIVLSARVPVTRLASFWLGLATAIVLGLNFLPVSGPIAFYFLVGPFLSGTLIDVLLVAIAIEAWVGRISRRFLLLPIAALATFYGFYASQQIGLRLAEAQLESQNIKAVSFDPASDKLVVKLRSVDSSRLLIEYRLPGIYEDATRRGGTPLTVLRTIADGENCVGNPHEGPYTVEMTPRTTRLFCISKREVPAPTSAVLVERVNDKPSIHGALLGYGSIIQFSRDGDILGRFEDDYMYVLTPFPFLAVGCGVNDSPAVLSCGVSGLGENVHLPGRAGDQVEDVVPAILGLVPRSDTELAEFGWTPKTAKSLTDPSPEPSSKAR